ncbi:MAG: enoyl-CoA hydratase/isomerase family protein [Burkholderiales bacterium]|nr:enoyl-CoA hydratase/isomerase family protein [Burkholderiales bacterium]
MATSERMIARKEGAIGWMIFNNPERRNALSLDMWEAVPVILADFGADPKVRVVVLAGAGDRAFASGADISQFERTRATPESAARSTEIGSRGRAAIAQCEKPTIAMIRGYCLGGGMAVALDCDLRVASEDARFGIPAAKLGIGYAFEGVKAICDLIGPARGKEMLFTGRHFDAQEALHLGLVNRVVPGAGLEGAVRAWTDAIARNAPLSIVAAKKAFNAAVQDPQDRDMKAVRAAAAACMASEDFKEGRRAFMDKRAPLFRGV